MGKLQSSNVRIRLYLLVACAILPSLLIILYSGITQRNKSIEQDLKRLENFTSTIAYLHAENTRQAKAVLQAVASLHEVKTLDTFKCNALFANILQENPELASIGLVDSSGSLLASGLPITERVSYADRDWFKDAVRTRGFSPGYYVLSRTAHIPVLPASLPVLGENGATVGVLYTSHKLQQYKDYFAGIDHPLDCRLTLLDRNGVRLISFASHGDPPPIGTPIVNKNWNTILASEADKGQFIAERYDGVRVVFVYHKLRLHPGDSPYMVVLANSSLDEVRASATEALTRNLYFLSIAALLAMIVANLLGRKIVGNQVEALKTSEERLRRAELVAGTGNWEIDMSNNSVYASDGAKHIYGLHKDVLTLDDIQSVPLPEYRSFLDKKLRLLIDKGEPYSVEFKIRRPADGCVCDIYSTATYDEQRKMFFGIVQDVTERRQMQEALVQTEKMMSVGGLAAGMAHEINNPLGGILQNAQVLIRRLTADTEVNREAASKVGCSFQVIGAFMESRGIISGLEHIRQSGERAAHVVKDMLAFSRKSESLNAPANINDLLDKAVELSSTDYDLKKNYDFKSIHIERSYGVDLPQVPCSNTQIQQVLMNLLGNAAHALIGTPTPRINLRTKIEENFVRIEVEDNGPGISEATRRRIFEPFFTTKPAGEGTGLGLSVSYFIITNNHRGTIEVDSSPGRGAKFIIRLPIQTTGGVTV